MFFDDSLESSANFSNAMLAYLCREPEHLIAVLRRTPSRVQLLTRQPTLVRRLWRELLFQWGRPDLPVYTALLRATLIPESELGEAHRHVIGCLLGQQPRDADQRDLECSGFVAEFRNVCFVEGQMRDFAWANPHGALIAWYLRTQTLDDDVADEIHWVFEPSNHPWHAASAIKEMYRLNGVRYAELKSVLARKGHSVPGALKP